MPDPTWSGKGPLLGATAVVLCYYSTNAVYWQIAMLVVDLGEAETPLTLGGVSSLCCGLRSVSGRSRMTCTYVDKRRWGNAALG